MKKQLAPPFPANHRELVTMKPLDGKQVEGEVRFGVYKQRASRSKESRRKWTQGITKKRDRVWIPVGLGMIQKIGVDLYQFRGVKFGPRGEKLFRIKMNENELKALIYLNGMSEAQIVNVGVRTKKHVVTYDPRFYFQTRKFLQDDVAELIKNGKITRARKWHE